MSSTSDPHMPPLFTRREKYYLVALSMAFVITSACIHFIVGASAESMIPKFRPEPSPSPQMIILDRFSTPTPAPTPVPSPTIAVAAPKKAPSPVRHVITIHTPARTERGPIHRSIEPPAMTDGPPSTAAPSVIEPTAMPVAPQTPAAAVAIMPSAFVHQIQPEYPQIARDEGAQGDVMIRVTIGPQGEVVDALVAVSSGNASLDAAALNAAKDSTYAPPLENGVPTTQAYLIVYTFSLEE